MQTFDQALAHLARERLIQTDDGRRLARDPINFDRLMRQPMRPVTRHERGENA